LWYPEKLLSSYPVRVSTALAKDGKHLHSRFFRADYVVKSPGVDMTELLGWLGEVGT